MGESLSPDRVFDFSRNEPEPHPTYDFFAPRPLPDYAGNLNNMNGWIKVDVPLLGELGEISKPLGAEVDGPMVDPVIDELAELIFEVEEHMVAPVMDMEGDLAMLFGDDDFRDDGPDDDEDDEEVWEVMASQMVQAVGRLEQVGTRMKQDQQDSTQRDEMIFRLSQQVQTLQAVVQHRDVQIQHLQTLVAKMSSREGTLMQCILRIDRRLAHLERRPPEPQ
uniref:Uncharacterized protein n=1 Tax=Tanacetum cinerariifolium TaxID=118510 RepID=A0A699H001_TANCI|nr:hypothetical protein [Tanacetum cinerariifolium]